MVLLAICIQHEMDHLVGKLFIDYLSPLKQQRIRQKVEKTRPPERPGLKDKNQRVRFTTYYFLRVHLTLQRVISTRC
ncbi:polypeptide deformylase [Salmonella sp. NCTC 11881]|nr:polypeptide deformylase [Salmonella sp. NCTC 11881]